MEECAVSQPPKITLTRLGAARTDQYLVADIGTNRPKDEFQQPVQAGLI
jgi:hypothetical protein